MSFEGTATLTSLYYTRVFLTGEGSKGQSIPSQKPDSLDGFDLEVKRDQRKDQALGTRKINSTGRGKKQSSTYSQILDEIIKHS